jgi:hypothetical protein
MLAEFHTLLIYSRTVQNSNYIGTVLSVQYCTQKYQRIIEHRWQISVPYNTEEYV